MQLHVLNYYDVFITVLGPEKKRAFPDMEMRTPSTTFIIEVDENAHDSYDVTCELTRLQTVSQV